MKKVDFSTVGRIGVLLGGTSAERVVSLESGEAVLRSLSKLGIDAVAIDLDGKIIEKISAADIDVAFIALHGGIGENGGIQSLLNIMEIPFTGSDMPSSALAMDKLVSKQIWKGCGVSTPPFVSLYDDSDFKKVLKLLAGSVMVKPAHEGSSIGMALAHDENELKQAYENARQYGTAIFAEQLLTGSEYTVAILNGQALPVIKLETDHGFYDYDAKYIDNNTRYLCPCGLSEKAEEEVKQLALEAFNSLQCRDWGRVDIMADNNGKFQVLEVNTVPGMTSHSLVPMAAKVVGLSFDGLVAEILSGVMKRTQV